MGACAGGWLCAHCNDNEIVGDGAQRKYRLKITSSTCKCSLAKSHFWWREWGGCVHVTGTVLRLLNCGSVCVCDSDCVYDCVCVTVTVCVTV